MKNYIPVFLFCLAIFSLQCKKDNFLEEEEPPMPNPTYPYGIDGSSIFIDKNTKLIYFHADATLNTYNYQINKIRRKSMNLFYYHAFGIGYYKGGPEVYVGTDKNIKILDGITLELKDSIPVFDSAASQNIRNIKTTNNLIIFGTCDNRVIVLNRDKKRKISQIADTDNRCLQRTTYVNKEENSINVVGVKFSETGILIHDKFDFTGTLTETNMATDVNVVYGTSIATNNNADYFVAGQKLFSKKGLLEVGHLNERYIDVIISEDGANIYGLEEKGFQIHVINFATQTFERIIELDAPAVRVFLDDNQLIVVHSSTITKQHPVVSKIPI